MPNSFYPYYKDSMGYGNTHLRNPSGGQFERQIFEELVDAKQ